MRGVTVSLEERRLLKALRRGDEAAFAQLHDRYNDRLVALARSFGCTRAVAEEVTQDTWAAVAREIHRFEGRSALKTWIFRILVNAAMAQSQREKRSIPLSETGDNVIELRRARGDRPLQPEERLIWKETVGEVHAAIATLAPAQRNVITLRDVEGWSADEVCGLLGISQGNQRVLLHRARAQVRRSLSGYLDVDAVAA